MKNILKITSAMALSGLLVLTSCQTDIDQDYAPANKPVATLASDNSASIAEGESKMFTVTISKPLSVQSDFKIDLLSGSMDDFATSADHLDEYEIGPEGWQVTVPATETSVTFSIDALIDLYPEPQETLRFRLTKGQFGNSVVSGGAIDFSVTIDNTESDLAGLELAWDGPASDEFCDMDFDVYLDTFGAYAFTGDCPEYLTECVNPNALCNSVLADGTHYIVVDLWDNHGITPGLAVPLRLTIGKIGVIMAELDLGDLYMSDSEDSANGSGGEMLAGWIEVTNGLYSIYNADGELVAQEGA